MHLPKAFTVSKSLAQFFVFRNFFNIYFIWEEIRVELHQYNVKI